MLTAAFSHAVIALPGVAGLNAVEHLRAPMPRVQDHLVQRFGFSAPQPSGCASLLSAGAGNGGGFRRGFSSGWKGGRPSPMFIRFQ